MSNSSEHSRPRIASYQLALLAVLEAADLIAPSSVAADAPADASEDGLALVGAAPSPEPR